MALITGAAGGLGQGLVQAFLAQGWQVVAACHSSNPYGETECLYPLPVDVTDPSAIGLLVEQVLRRWRRIDVLVNNAGLAVDKPCWQLEDGEWERVLQVNLKGAFLCSRAVVAAMMAQQSGHIINVASFSARFGQRGQANYSAAKAGLLGLTEALARELGKANTRVNAVLPGVLPTGMTAHLGEDIMRDFAAANALGRINSIQEVAQFIVFLAGMENVSGQLFQLDSRIGRWA